MSYEISLSKKTDSLGRSELSLRLRLGKIDQQVLTSLYISPKYVRWETYKSSKGKESKRLVISVPRSKDEEAWHALGVKEKLDSMINYIDVQLEQTDSNTIRKGWLAQQVESFLSPRDTHDDDDEDSETEPIVGQTIFEQYEEFLASRKVTPGTRGQYMVFCRILQRYELYQQVAKSKDFHLSVSYFNEKTLAKLSKYIKDEYKLLKRFPMIAKKVPESRTPGERGQNTINGYLKKLRAFLMWAMDQGLIAASPFRKFKIAQEVYGTPYYITLDERHQIEETDFSSRPALAVQRDIFVFHCCVGCRVSDLRCLTVDNVINGCVHYIARKTSAGNPVTIKVPLNKTALAILERYADPDRKSLLPFISDQKYNEAIKEIFTLAGVTRNVVVRNSLTGEQEIRPINEIASSHMARRFMVGTVYSKFKDQALVSELTGHAPGSRAFARYREIDEAMKREMVSVIE